jgi:hypothetical protein
MLGLAAGMFPAPPRRQQEAEAMHERNDVRAGSVGLAAVELVGILVAAAAVAAAGCGPRTYQGSAPWSPSGGAPLERDDVKDLPPGGASGTGYSGTYVVVAASRDGCACRSGDPELVCGGGVEEGAFLAAVQVNGAFTLVAGDPLEGGIDADGTFLVGGVGDVWNQATGERIGETYTLVEGAVSWSGTAPEALDASWETRAQFYYAGTAYDCDLFLSLHALYDF